jgi:hypothetical protein
MIDQQGDDDCVQSQKNATEGGEEPHKATEHAEMVHNQTKFNGDDLKTSKGIEDDHKDI